MFLTKTKKSPYYQLVYEVEGKRTTVSTKTKSKSEAINFHKNFRVEKSVIKKVTPISLEQFSIEYINYCKTCRSKSYINCSKITSFKKFIPFIGNILLNKITSRQVDQFVNSILSYSQSSASLYYRTLKAAFSKAVVWEYIIENPFKKIKAPKQVKSFPIFINKEELQLIIDNTKHQFLKDIFITGFYTGMRLGELTNMNWSWIDFNQNSIIIKNSNGFTTKSKEERVIPIHQKVKKVLTRRYSTNGKSAFIFYCNSGTKLNEDFVSKQFKKTVRAAKVNDNIHFHSLRHSFASALVQRGVSLYTVKELLGHQNFQTTQVYSHLTQQSLSTAVNQL